MVKEFGKPLVIEEVPTPEPKDRQVLIKVLGAGICHSDVHVWRGDWKTEGIPPKLPIVLSHEIVGTVVARGDKVPEEIKEGRSYLVYAWQYAKEDEYVLRGLTHLSSYPVYLAVTVDGGMQEYFLVSDYRFLVDVEGLEDLPAAAPLGCAGLTTYRAVKKALPYLEPGDYAAVVGLGGLGSYAVQWLRALAPYVSVIGVDVRDEPIEFVSKITKLDATVNASKVDPAKAIGEITKGRGLKAVINLVGKDPTVVLYSRLLARTGVHVLVGLMALEVKVPVLPIVVGELSIVGSVVGTITDQMEVVSAARRGMVNYRDAVSRRLKLEEATEGLEALEKAQALGRLVVVF